MMRMRKSIHLIWRVRMSNKFKVYGSKEAKYECIVDAEDAVQAWDKSTGPSVRWILVDDEDLDNIEPYEVEEFR